MKGPSALQSKVSNGGCNGGGTCPAMPKLRGEITGEEEGQGKGRGAKGRGGLTVNVSVCKMLLHAGFQTRLFSLIRSFSAAVVYIATIVTA